MEELLELKAHIEQGRYADALALIAEMEEMSKDDKINKVESFLEILLIHLIKKRAENRTTRSWEYSISNALFHIRKINKRRKVGGTYLSEEELRNSIDEVYSMALKRASLEAFEGILRESELAEKVHENAVKTEALKLILQTQGAS